MNEQSIEDAFTVEEPHAPGCRGSWDWGYASLSMSDDGEELLFRTTCEAYKCFAYVSIPVKDLLRFAPSGKD
jgi:hypothetical protein